MLTNNKIIGALIAVAFILITGVATRYTAAIDVLPSVEIQNEASTIDTVHFATTAYGADTLTSTGILPSIGTTTTIHINGVIRDNNGDVNIASSSMSLVLHKTSATNSCTEDKNDCYKVTTGCTVNYTYGNEIEAAYNCPVDIAYWIDATDAASIFSLDNWTAHLSVQDKAGLTAVRDANIEVRSLLALNLPDSIDYGTRSLAEVSTDITNIHTPLIQKGNTKADVEVNGGRMVCDVLGSLATSSQAWALIDTDYQNSTPISSVFEPTYRNIGLRTDESSELSDSLYWNIAVPASGVKGRCTGSNTMTIYAQGTEDAYLIDGRLQNVKFTTGRRSGFTGAAGNFGIKLGETYTFTVGGVTLGTIAYNNIPEDRLVFFQDILGLPRTNVTDPRLVKLGQFLQSLAEETDLTGSTTLSIPSSAYTELTANIDFATVNTVALEAEVQKVHTGKSLRSAAQASGHFLDTLVAERILDVFTVSTIQDVNTTISPTSTTTIEGYPTSFTVNPATGYTVAASGCGGTLVGNTYTVPAVTSDCTVTTTATPIAYAITTAGTNVTFSPTTRTVNYSDTTTFTITPNTGYDLTGVSGCSGTLSGNIYTTGVITGDCTVTAVTAIQTFPVTYNINGATSGTAPASQTKTYGVSLTLQSNSGNLAKTGYTFVGWNTSADGTGTDYAVGGSYTANASTTLYAKWEIKTYTVSTAGTNVTFSPTTQTVNHGTTTIFTVTPSAGYDLTGVSGCSGTLSGNTYTTGVITGACTVTAITALQTFPVTYNANGATSGTAPANQTKTYGVTLTLQTNSGTLAKTGYTFSGWNTAADGTGTDYVVSGAYTANAAVTLYAKWIIKTYLVSTSGSNATFSPTSQTVNHGTTTIFTVTPNTGYNLTSASGCAGTLSGNTYTTGVITAACTVTAVTALQTFPVTYNANGATSGATPANQTKTYGVSLTLQSNSGNLAKTGYNFTGWNTAADGTGTNYAAGGSYTANAAVTLYAVWTIKTYTVSTSGSNLTFTPTTRTVNHGDSTTFTLTPATGYVVTSASGCAGTLSGNTYTTGVITAVCTVTAVTALQTFPVTYNANGATSGTVPASQTKTYNVSLTLQTNSGNLAKTGYTFTGWNTATDGTGTNYATSSAYTANASTTLYAKWTINTYTVSTTGDNVTFTPTSRTVMYGDSTTFTITAKTGYSLTGASGCAGTLSGNTYTTGTIIGACTVTSTTIQPISTIAYSGGPYDQTGLIKNQGGYYRTAVFGTQTWMKDNMNVGTMITGATSQANNAVIEKYCYGNDGGNCNNDGGFYQWNEAMQYSVTEGAQGICPTGWHIPTDANYKTLEIFLGMTSAAADSSGWRGTDQGTKLKVGGSSGYEAPISGYRHSGGTFSSIGTQTYFWTSSVSSSNSWRRFLASTGTQVNRDVLSRTYGFSIRCIKN